MWVFYLISLPLTLGMVTVTLRYFAGPGVPRYVIATVGYAWFCSLSFIILVPADIWTGDPASIIGGVVDYIKELQQELHSLAVKKHCKAYAEQVLNPRLASTANSRPLIKSTSPLSPCLPVPISPRTPTPGSPYKPCGGGTLRPARALLRQVFPLEPPRHDSGGTSRRRNDALPPSPQQAFTGRRNSSSTYHAPHQQDFSSASDELKPASERQPAYLCTAATQPRDRPPMP